ncbi:MAG: MtnX-like HAD-IB family phosphatase [Chloroflexota bacterium]
MNYYAKAAIFVDFDGTIVQRDIGDELFIALGRFEPFHKQLLAGELKIGDYWRELFANLKEGTDPEAIREFARGEQVDPYFVEFYKFCKSNGLPVAVVSDGFDLYIKEVLAGLGIEDMPVYCNKAEFVQGVWRLDYPRASESCKCLCASCKRNSVISQVDDETAIIYIGDGYSDYCAAEHSDIIFAKKHLARYCSAHKLPYYPYKSFFDIIKILKAGIDRGKWRARRGAALARKSAFESE